MNRPAIAVATLLILTGIAGGAWFFSKAITPVEPVLQKATVLPEPRPLAFDLTRHDGSSLTPDALRGRWHLLFFGFTHCPDICPATLQQLSVARKRLAEAGATDLPEILLISVDPARDTPARLAEYVAHFGDGVSGATGDHDALRELTSALGIHYEVPVPDGDDYQVSHSPAVVLLNPAAEYAAVFSSPHDIGAFVNDLPVITGGD